MGREEIMASTRPVSALACWLTYIAAFATVAFIFWIFCLASRNTSLYDPAWVLLPLAISAGWILTSPNDLSLRGTIAMGLLVLWCIRYNITWPWDGWVKGIETEDWRYVEMAKNEWIGSNTITYWVGASLIGSHIVPTWLVYWALAPLQSVWTLGQTEATLPIALLDYIAVAITLVAIGI